MRTLALIVALFAAWTAHAQSDDSIITFGSTDAHNCYNAAEGNPTGTLGDCNEALKSRELSHRERVATLVNRGIVLNHRRAYAAAIADFEAALSLDPNVSAAYVNRGNSYFANQQFDLAIDDYTQSLQMDPQKPYIAHYNRGLANEAIREVELAYADFVRVTELRPDWEPAAMRVQRYREKGFEPND